MDLTNDYVIVRRDLVTTIAMGRHSWRLAMLLDWLIRHCGSDQLTLSASAQDISDHMLGAMPKSAVQDALRALIAWGLVVRERNGTSLSYGVNHSVVVERFKQKREHLPADDWARSDEGLADLVRYLGQHNSTMTQGPTTIN